MCRTRSVFGNALFQIDSFFVNTTQRVRGVKTKSNRESNFSLLHNNCSNPTNYRFKCLKRISGVVKNGLLWPAQFWSTRSTVFVFCFVIIHYCIYKERPKWHSPKVQRLLYLLLHCCCTSLSNKQKRKGN